MTTYTINRDTLDGPDHFELELSWMVERRWPVVTCAWHLGKVFALSDEEMAEAEEWLHSEFGQDGFYDR